jgi:tRNA threonylcarbamoyladenosine biosynthesis protein TsaE
MVHEYHMASDYDSRTFEISSPDELRAIAAYIIERVAEKKNSCATVLGLYGNLGAGKTAFTQVLARELGVAGQLTSPTFVIQKTYPIHAESVVGTASELHFTKLVHIDAYRLHKGSELDVIGWQKTLRDPQSLVCIEWPENVADVMPAHTKIEFEHAGDGKRKVTIVS